MTLKIIEQLEHMDKTDPSDERFGIAVSAHWDYIKEYIDTVEATLKTHTLSPPILDLGDELEEIRKRLGAE